MTLGQRSFSAAAGFSSAQAAGLKLKWAFGFDGENAAAANPTIVGDRVFVGSGSGRVYALGLKDGCIHWTFKADGGVRAAIIGRRGARSRLASDRLLRRHARDALQRRRGHRRAALEEADGRASIGADHGVAVLYNGRLYVPLSSSEEGDRRRSRPTSCCTFRGSVVGARSGDRRRVVAHVHDRGAADAARRRTPRARSSSDPRARPSGRRRPWIP